MKYARAIENQLKDRTEERARERENEEERKIGKYLCNFASAYARLDVDV